MNQVLKSEFVYLMLKGNNGIYGIVKTKKLAELINERQGFIYRIKKIQTNTVGDLIGVLEI